jgi:hypothetical protein
MLFLLERGIVRANQIPWTFIMAPLPRVVLYFGLRYLLDYFTSLWAQKTAIIKCFSQLWP